MGGDGSRISLLFGFMLALTLCVVAGVIASSALGILQRSIPSVPAPSKNVMRQSGLSSTQPFTRLTPTLSIQQPSPTPASSPTATPILVVIPPTPTPENSTATPTDTAVPTSTPTDTPTPIIAMTPSPTLTPTDTATPVPTPYAGPYREGNGVDLHARRLSAPLRLDGELSEWDGSAGQDLSYILSGVQAYKGMADIAGTVFTQWDERYLYLAARVLDDVHVQTQRGERIDWGDCLIIWLDAALAEDFDSTVADGDDYQIGLSPGDFAMLPPEAVVWRPQRRADWDQAIIVAARPRGDGYSLEAAIPWAMFNRQPATGSAFGFSVQLLDNDQPGAAVQDTMLTGSPNFRPGVPTTFGNLILD